MLGTWLFLRLLTQLIAIIASVIKPQSPLEQNYPAVWPPFTPFAAWLNRLLLQPWNRWDVEWYLKIVSEGYHPTNGTAQFHPLYPWVSTPLARLGIDPLLSLSLVGMICGLLFLLVFQQLARLDQSPDQIQNSTLSLLFFPLTFILFIPYSEPLFLLCAGLCLLLARRKNWWLAGLTGGLAALTRQQGILLLLPLAWEIWETAGYNLKAVLKNRSGLIGLALIPLGTFLWLLYRWLLLGDLNPDFSSLNGLIYSVAISPSAARVVEIQKFVPPWETLWIAGNMAFTQLDADLALNLIMAFWFVGLTLIAWPNMQTSDRIYVVATILLSFSYYTGPIHPCMGLPRHLILGFPVFLGLGARLRRPWQRLLIIGLGFAGLLILTMFFGLHGWVP